MIEKIIEIIEDMKGYDVVVYDYAEENPWVDYMIVASSDNIRTTHAIAEEIYDVVRKEFQMNVKLESAKESRWVLIDIGNVVVHLFVEEEREFYNVDELWKNVKKIRDDYGAK